MLAVRRRLRRRRMVLLLTPCGTRPWRRAGEGASPIRGFGLSWPIFQARRVENLVMVTYLRGCGSGCTVCRVRHFGVLKDIFAISLL